MLKLALGVLALAAAQSAPSVQPGKVKPPAGAKAPRSAPAAQAAAKQLTFEPKTMVDGETLQVILGQRAVFRIGETGKPVIEKVEKGQLAAAHPDGEVKETFQAPETGTLAAALDGSAEKRATMLKVWNGTDADLSFRPVLFLWRGADTVTPVLGPRCFVAAHTARTESWPKPIAAISLRHFSQNRGSKPTSTSCSVSVASQ